MSFVLVHIMHSIIACQAEWNCSPFYLVIWVPFYVVTFPFAEFNYVLKNYPETKAFHFENGRRCAFSTGDTIIRSKNNLCDILYFQFRFAANYFHFLEEKLYLTTVFLLVLFGACLLPHPSCKIACLTSFSTLLFH